MNNKRWTLKSRFTRWLVLMLCVQALLIAVPSAWFLNSSLDRELGALVEEELAEFASDYAHGLGVHEDDDDDSWAQELAGILGISEGEYSSVDRVRIAIFEAVSGSLEAEHRENPLAFGLWIDDTLVSQAGAGTLFDEAFSDRESGVTIALDTRVDFGGDSAWQATRLRGGEVVVVVVDGSVQSAVLLRFTYVAGAFLLLGLGIALALGMWGARTASRLFEQVGDHARQVGSGSDAPVQELDLERLPEEVRSVAVALQVGLEGLRGETRRFRMMTAGLAHELRSPIQNVVGEIEVALMKDRSADQYRDVLASNLDEVRELGDAVHNLMLLCTEQRGRNELPPEEFDLGFEAGIRLAGERSLAKRKGVVLRTEVVGDVMVCADREALLCAVRNLVSNAVSWTPTGGSVEVMIDGTGSQLAVLVDDSGPGVAGDMREAIFEPFFRGPVADGQRSGYGLGLAIVRGAVEAQGGEVRIETSPRGGARFRVLIPRSS